MLTKINCHEVILCRLCFVEKTCCILSEPACTFLFEFKVTTFNSIAESLQFCKGSECPLVSDKKFGLKLGLNSIRYIRSLHSGEC